MAIRSTTAAITAAEDGTGAEATIEGARTGTSHDQSCQDIERNSPHTKGQLKSLLLIRTPSNRRTKNWLYRIYSISPTGLSLEEVVQQKYSADHRNCDQTPLLD